MLIWILPVRVRSARLRPVRDLRHPEGEAGSRRLREPLQPTGRAQSQFQSFACVHRRPARSAGTPTRTSRTGMAGYPPTCRPHHTQ
jgi:hypothetical protein